MSYYTISKEGDIKENNMYIIENKDIQVHKVAQTIEEAEKILKQMELVFEHKFTVKEERDVWSVNYEH